MKRSPLRRRRPPQRPAYHAEWLVGRDYCWLCGWRSGEWSDEGPRKLGTHEIVRGYNRCKAFVEPSCWIRTCNVCHDRHLDGMAIENQLVIKAIRDPEHLDRLLVNLLRVQRPNAIAEKDVWKVLEPVLILLGWQKPE